MSPTRILADTLWEIYQGDSRLPPAGSSRSQPSLRQGGLHAAEDGMVSFVTVVAVLFFLVLLGLLLNAARVTNRKVEVQNGADAVAYSSALCMARGMNAVTAANHVMGELTAITVLVDALAGAEYSSSGPRYCPQSGSLNNSVNTVFTAGSLIPGFTAGNAPSTRTMVVKDNGQHRAGATIYDARLTLKYWTWYALAVRGIAAAAAFVPIIGPPISAALTALAELAFIKIQQEWLFLDAMETIAGALTPLHHLVDQVLPLVHGYAVSIVAQTPLALQATVRSVSQSNGITTGALYPLALDMRLPVIPEPPPGTGQDTYQPGQGGSLPERAGDLIGAIDAGRNLRNSKNPFLKDTLGKLAGVLDSLGVFPPDPGPDGYPTDNPSQKPFVDMRIDHTTERYSQWVRATYPWVNAWRGPVRAAMRDFLTLSMTERWYRNWTNKYTLARSHYYRSTAGGSLHMYVMQDSAFDRKGQEPWTRADGSRLAEQRFMVNGFAYRPPPKVVSSAIYKQPNPDGIAAYAQAMIYNANEKASAPGDFQPQVGWDTLNWKSPIAQSGAYEFEKGDNLSGGGSWTQALDFLHPSGQQPVIMLNWQAKLVPVTRLDEAVQSGSLPAKIQKLLRPALDVPGLTNH